MNWRNKLHLFLLENKLASLLISAGAILKIFLVSSSNSTSIFLEPDSFKYLNVTENYSSYLGLRKGARKLGFLSDITRLSIISKVFRRLQHQANSYLSDFITCIYSNWNLFNFKESSRKANCDYNLDSFCT